MVKQGFRQPSKWEMDEYYKSINIDKCPFCRSSLGKIAVMKRKAHKLCKCKKCGMTIKDRRTGTVVW